MNSTIAIEKRFRTIFDKPRTDSIELNIVLNFRIFLPGGKKTIYIKPDKNQ